MAANYVEVSYHYRYNDLTWYLGRHGKPLSAELFAAVAPLLSGKLPSVEGDCWIQQLFHGFKEWISYVPQLPRLPDDFNPLTVPHAVHVMRSKEDPQLLLIELWLGTSCPDSHCSPIPDGADPSPPKTPISS